MRKACKTTLRPRKAELGRDLGVSLQIFFCNEDTVKIRLAEKSPTQKSALFVRAQKELNCTSGFFCNPGRKSFGRKTQDHPSALVAKGQDWPFYSTVYSTEGPRLALLAATKEISYLCQTRLRDQTAAPVHGEDATGAGEWAQACSVAPVLFGWSVGV